MALEHLEARIAPATILTFTDVDGDTVNIVSDKALTASVSFTGDLNPAQLLITGAGLDGANLATVVKKGPNGDGLVNIGRIVATGLDLGTVTVKGDLGKIVCGNTGNSLPALKALKVRSMGVLGLETQGTGDLVSTISGDLGSLAVAADVNGARLAVAGKIGTVKIGGDLRGAAAGSSGRIEATGLTSLTIGGDLAAGVGNESGKIVVSGGVGKITIGGSLYGAIDGTADTTGQIFASGNVGSITIKRDIFGSASQQRAIDIQGNIGPITIGGSLLGLGGTDSASIYVTGNSGAVKIGRDLSGGGGSKSGSIYITGSTGAVKIGRDILGDIGNFSASLIIGGKVNGSFSVAGDIRGGTGSYVDGVVIRQVSFGGAVGAVRVGGDIVGSTGRGSATFLLNGDAPSFFLGGSLTGGGNEQMGILLFPGGAIGMGNVKSVTILGDIRENGLGGGHFAAGNVGKLLIKGSIFGTNDGNSVHVVSGPVVKVGNVTAARIEGSIVGGFTPEASSPDYDFTITGNAGKIEVLGSLDGSTAFGSGGISIAGNAASIKIGGGLHGVAGNNSAAITAGNRIGALSIGGSITSDGGIYTVAQVTAKSFGKVTVVGDLIGGNAGAGELRATTGGVDGITITGSLYAGTAGGAITAALGLGAVKIGGSISGGYGMNHNSIIALKATSITVGGDLIANGTGNNTILNIRESAGVVKIGGSVIGNAADPAHLAFALTAGDTRAGFTSLSIKGSVTNGLITGGVLGNKAPSNGDAVLGPITVGGDWAASAMAAGVDRKNDMDFASADDEILANATPALSRIAAITIKGQVVGSSTANDHFGFVAQSFGPVKFAGVLYKASAVPVDLSPLTHDVTLRQL